MSIRIATAMLLLSASVMLAPAHAQTHAQPAPAAAPERPLTAADLEGLRAELRSSKKQVTAATLKLTDAEATKFWPVYDQYAAELIKINDSR
jgi:Spy/CpxP family protein refolding chaperone